MSNDRNAMTDALSTALQMARAMPETTGLVGYGVAELIDEAGQTKQLVPFANLITTAGDQYYAQKGIASVAPASAAAPTAVSGMKLGSGTTAASKSGAGAALVTYLTGSNVAFDATYPQAAAVAGTDTGWNATYKTTFAAGVGTGTINEVVIVTDSATNATSAAAATISRAILSTITKAAGDSLAVTWSHKFLGA